MAPDPRPMSRCSSSRTSAFGSITWSEGPCRVAGAPADKPHSDHHNHREIMKIKVMSDLHCPSMMSRRDFLATGAVAAGAFGLSQCGPVAAEAGEMSRFPLIGFSKPFQKLDAEQTAELVA